MSIFNCQFYSPRLYNDEIPTDTKQVWNYNEAICDYQEATSTIELISNATTGAEFYLRKEITYGEFVIITFLMIFLIFGIFKFLTNFIIPKFISLRR